MTHDEHLLLQELLGAYVLHALDPDEISAVDEHLPTCPKCRAEVDELREVTAHLAQAGAPAPDGVWDRIAATIATTNAGAPPPMRLVVGGRAEQPASRGAAAWTRVRPFAAAAAVVILGGLTVQVVRQQHRLDDYQAAGGLSVEFSSMLADPDARTIDLESADGDPLAHAVVLPSGAGILQAEGLPDLDDGVYQLWGTDGGEVVSLRVVDRHGALVAFDADPDTTTLMITAEDEPVPESDKAPVVLGTFT